MLSRGPKVLSRKPRTLSGRGLHYTTDAPLVERSRRSWEKPHLPNTTGTPASYRPPGHDYQGGKRDRATGDYEAWTPES